MNTWVDQSWEDPEEAENIWHGGLNEPRNVHVVGHRDGFLQSQSCGLKRHIELQDSEGEATYTMDRITVVTRT